MLTQFTDSTALFVKLQSIMRKQYNLWYIPMWGYPIDWDDFLWVPIWHATRDHKFFDR